MAFTGSMHTQEEGTIQWHRLLKVILEFYLPWLSTSRLINASQSSTHITGMISKFHTQVEIERNKSNELRILGTCSGLLANKQLIVLIIFKTIVLFFKVYVRMVV